jgi:nucleoside-diphosphate-sugar epimerase
MRSFLSLNDSVQALMIALKNPASVGLVQTWNQLSEWHSMNAIAEMVIDVGNEMGLNPKAQWIDTPRMEHTGDHYYNFITERLTSKGYIPTRKIKDEIRFCLELLLPHKKHLDKLRDVVIPNIKFKR